MLNKFEHLLIKGLISEKELQIASEISRESNVSVESVLNHQFLIPKAFIGQSLSLHFNCEFIAHDPDMPVATEMFQDLFRTALLNDCWVPISWDDDGIVVLVDDPFDFAKKAIIEITFEFCPIFYAVGIKEDIEAIINMSFDQLEIDKLFLATECAMHTSDATEIVGDIIICL